MGGNLAGCGRTPQLVRYLLTGPLELRIELFEPAGNLDRPSMVAEVSANFAHHGRNGERQKIRTVLSVEAVHRLNQPDSCHLDEVFERFTAITEPACDVVGGGRQRSMITSRWRWYSIDCSSSITRRRHMAVTSAYSDLGPDVTRTAPLFRRPDKGGSELNLKNVRQASAISRVSVLSGLSVVG